MKDITVLRKFVERFEKLKIGIVQDTDHKLWINATRSCEILNLVVSRDTVKTYCKEHQCKSFPNRRGRMIPYISESGFYFLALRADVESAEKGISWLTDDIVARLETKASAVKSLQENDQLWRNKRLNGIQAIANLLLEYTDDGYSMKEASKIVRERKNVTFTDIKNAKNFFIWNNYQNHGLEECLNLIEHGYISFDSAVALMDLITKPEVNLSIKEAIAEMVKLFPTVKTPKVIEYDKMVVSRHIVSRYRKLKLNE